MNIFNKQYTLFAGLASCTIYRRRSNLENPAVGVPSKTAFLSFAFVQDQREVCHCARYMMCFAGSKMRKICAPSKSHDDSWTNASWSFGRTHRCLMPLSRHGRLFQKRAQAFSSFWFLHGWPFREVGQGARFTTWKSLCFGKVDRVILKDNVVIALREDKWEAGHGGSDVYMQIARDYDLLVRVLVESTETAAINFLSHGASCFLICVLGTYCCILIMTLIVWTLPRTHVIHMWWILRRPQTHCRTTFQPSVHASWLH